MHFSTILALVSSHALLVAAQEEITQDAEANFPFESTQLTWRDTLGNPFLRFGNTSLPQNTTAQPPCKAWPGSHDWPSDDEWKQFNKSIDGALLRPDPPGLACHEGPKRDAAQCEWLVRDAGRTSFWIDNPLAVLTQWPQGSTCAVALDAKGMCTRGGFPEYVVKVATVKHVQAAVNFARNKNVRVVIK